MTPEYQGTAALGKEPHQLEPGEWTWWDGHYVAHCPGPWDLLANLSAHTCTLEANGMLTVSPSILCSNGRESWHGFLEKGVWREC